LNIGFESTLTGRLGAVVTAGIFYYLNSFDFMSGFLFDLADSRIEGSLPSV